MRLLYIILPMFFLSALGCKRSTEDMLIGTWRFKLVISSTGFVIKDTVHSYEEYKFLNKEKFVLYWRSGDVGGGRESQGEKGTWKLREIEENGIKSHLIGLRIKNPYDVYEKELRILKLTEDEMIILEEVERKNDRNVIKVCYYKKE